MCQTQYYCTRAADRNIFLSLIKSRTCELFNIAFLFLISKIIREINLSTNKFDNLKSINNQTHRYGK